jgi:hypothetical protein
MEREHRFAPRKVLTAAKAQEFATVGYGLANENIT